MEAARRLELSEAELAARVFDPVAQHVERAAPLDLGGEAFEELLPYGRTVVLFQLLPFRRLRREHEVHHVARKKTERAVVVLRAAPAVAARRGLAERRLHLTDERGVADAGVRAVPQQP